MDLQNRACDDHAARKSLADLPEELIEYIASFVSQESTSLLDLSSTCKKFRRITHDLLLERHFTDRTFLFMDRASLETLLSISQHAVFAKALKRLSFSFATLEEALYLVSEDLTCCHEECEDIKTLTAPLRDIDDHLHRTHNMLLEAERRFRDSGRHVRLLRKIFSNFKAIEHIPAVMAGRPDFLSERDQESIWGYGRLQRQIGSPTVPCMAVDTVDEELFPLLCQIMREAEYPVTHLHLGSEKYGTLLSLFEGLRDVYAFSNLKVLHLAIETTWHEALDFRHGVREKFNMHLEGFGAFLQECYHLESLTLSRIYHRNRAVCSRIFGAVRKAVVGEYESKKPAMKGLRALSLEGFAFRWQDLVLAVARTRSTLEYLRVDKEECQEIQPENPATRLREACGVYNLQLCGGMFETSDSE